MEASKANQLFIDRILSVLAQSPHTIELAILFGSFAQGREHAKSDIDLAILPSHALPIEDHLGLIQALESALNREIDLVDLSNCGPTVKEEALTSGKVILNLNPMRYAQVMKSFLLDKEDWGRSRSLIRSELRKRVFKK